jgi:pimeloyl-ACP methyl ester carboxylesterase
MIDLERATPRLDAHFGLESREIFARDRSRSGAPIQGWVGRDNGRLRGHLLLIFHGGSRTRIGMELVWSWTLKGWENRHAVMSDLDHFDYTTVPGVAKLNKPALIVHLDMCMNPAAARWHFESTPTPDKKLIWENGANHFQNYDQPDVVDRTVGHAAGWFRDHVA